MIRGAPPLEPGLSRPEGARMPAAGRQLVVHGSLLAFAVAILARAVQVQVVDGARWAERAERQQVFDRPVEPPRGRILDATGAVLVESRELVRIRVAPRDLIDPRPRARGPRDHRPALRAALRDLQVPDPWIRRATDTTRAWVELPMLHRPSEVETVARVRGVHAARVLQRASAAPPGIQRIVGAVNAEQVAVGGLELELDSLLRGTQGRRSLVRDGRGGLIETPDLVGREARPGHTVILTFNQSLQQIAERELHEAVRRTGASGGDLVLLDPRDGAVLALAGVRDQRPASQATALIEPYEPGSVMKPFAIARLLDEGRARPDEVVNTEGGVWNTGRRTLRDEHKAATMSVRDVVRLSSNIGTAKLVQRFTPAEAYGALRDFGFGALTGVPFPAESRGRLPLPATWNGETQTSLAIGYALSATPLQLANAYAAIANGGELLQPVFVREIRDAEGRPVYRHQRRVVRRVLQPGTAAAMREILQSVVDSGTARRATLQTFDVAGKSGTARIGGRGGYEGGRYNATFAGMFPAQDPRLVIVARLSDPKGEYFGGLVAAPLVNGVLQAALATRDALADRGALLAAARPLPQRSPARAAVAETVAVGGARGASDSAGGEPADAEGDGARDGGDDAAAGRVVVALPLAAAPPARSSEPPRPVPSVAGLDLRDAVHRLHRAGFEVRVVAGVDGRTRPAAGVLARRGSVVVLEHAP
jgi:cell division protein FtsI (penicillin-binding protein 3)